MIRYIKNDQHYNLLLEQILNRLVPAYFNGDGVERFGKAMGTQGNAAFLRWFPRYPLQFCNVCKRPDINVLYQPRNALWKYLMTAARRYCLVLQIQ